MKKFLSAVFTVMFCFSMIMPVAQAEWIGGGDGIAVIWIKVKPLRGETLWQTCRRVYQRDTYGARPGKGRVVYCLIDSSRIYSYGEVKQNFNNKR